MTKRCCWANAAMLDYHDFEWGVPSHDDKYLFEMLVLESFQAGLSWEIILKKREAFRIAFDDFDVQKVARYTNAKTDELLQNTGIVRNRSKVIAAVTNAQVFMDIQTEYGSFDAYIWGFSNGRVVKNMDDVFPTQSELSVSISKDLKRRGMKFVGPVIIYSYLQAIGVIDDHEKACFRY